MPEYCFTCVNCDKDFTKVIKIIEYDLSKVRCTHCRSKKVQRDYASENKISISKDFRVCNGQK
jgi:DNA-directed RNA polymerase subunit RPC12/RpoP